MTFTEEAVEAAVKAACNAANVHFACSYPSCNCRHMAKSIRAALTAASAVMANPQKKDER